MAASSANTSAPRLISLDQFRGYTVAGMFLVNYIDPYEVMPTVLRHHKHYCTYPDTIMPQFLFAVGFALRLTFERNVQVRGLAAAYAHVVKRVLGLLLVALVIYHAPAAAATWEELKSLGVARALHDPLKRYWFQTLTHIAVTSLWILPVLLARPIVRIAFLLGSLALHVALSYWFSFEWCNIEPFGIDGGPLGFLTWSTPAIVGTLACDAVFAPGGRPRLAAMSFWGIVLMCCGYLLSCGTRLYDVPADQVEALRSEKLARDPVFPPLSAFEGRPWQSLLAEPPFVAPPGQDHRKWNYWMMSHRAATPSYVLFGAGLALVIYTLFYVACDRYGWQSGFFRTFGVNALVGYILHQIVERAIQPFVPKDAPGYYVWGSVAVYFLILYVILRHLEKQKIYLRI